MVSPDLTLDDLVSPDITNDSPEIITIDDSPEVITIDDSDSSRSNQSQRSKKRKPKATQRKKAKSASPKSPKATQRKSKAKSASPKSPKAKKRKSASPESPKANVDPPPKENKAKKHKTEVEKRYGQRARLYEEALRKGDLDTADKMMREIEAIDDAYPSASNQPRKETRQPIRKLSRKEIRELGEASRHPDPDKIETQIEFQNLRAAMVGSRLGRKVFIEFPNTPFGPYTYHVMLTRNSILFQNKREQDCITIDIERTHIELEYYYYEVPINQCPHVPHHLFFFFLRQLGLLFKKNIFLTDASVKTIEKSDCVVEAPVFAFAGYMTFYQRHGFVNKEFDEFVYYLQNMSYRQFCGVGAPEPIHPNILKWLSYNQLSEDSNMAIICKAVVDECRSNEKKKESKDTTFVAWFARFIGNRAAAINSNHYIPHHYTTRWVLKPSET